MELPNDIVETIFSHLDLTDKYTMGCTCTEYKHHRATFKRHQFLGKAGPFAQYGVLKDYIESLDAGHYEPPNELEMQYALGTQGAKPVIETCRQLFWGRSNTTKLNKYRFVDEELHDLIMDDLCFDCPDEVLILSFFLKVHKHENSLAGWEHGIGPITIDHMHDLVESELPDNWIIDVQCSKGVFYSSLIGHTMDYEKLPPKFYDFLTEFLDKFPSSRNLFPHELRVYPGPGS